MQLTPRLLLTAYSQGVFPMAHDDGQIYWYDPDPRAIIPLDAFHVPRRLARTIRAGKFEVRMDEAFTAVMQACAAAAPYRETTWISNEIIDVYTQLHQLGFAHSVECWQNGELVGGLYGVALQGLFAGESMFSRVPDSSKVALVHLVRHLQDNEFRLLDTQFMTNHLRQFGTVEISAATYRHRLQQAMLQPATF